MSLKAAFLEVIKQPQEILIIAHQDPDLDAVGSSLGLAHQLKALGHHPQIWLADPISRLAQKLPGTEMITRTMPDSLPEVVFVLDCANFSRIKNNDVFTRKITKDIVVFNIDHHIDNPCEGTHNWVDTTASSVGEMLSALFSDCDLRFNQDAATCLYAALTFDTGRFLFSNTTANTFEHAAKLLKCGADFNFVSLQLFQSQTPEDIQVQQIAYQNLRIDAQKRYAYTHIPLGAPQTEIKAIDVIRMLDEIPIFMAFTLYENEIKVSLRSKSEFDVQKVAAKFGGGGHLKAAGITFKEDLPTVIAKVCQAIETALG